MAIPSQAKATMATFKERECSVENCNNHFIPTGPAAKFCPSCADEKRKERARIGTQAYRIRHNLVKKPGSGKGGNASRGRDDSQFKTGIAFFMKIRRKLKIERRYCERCNADLINAGRFNWVIHHKDHDRTNNTIGNFELLCKRCHQIEHDCYKAFEGVETIPEGSRG